MALSAGIQKQAANPNKFQAGVPTGALLDGATFGAQAITDIIIGSGCFISDNDGLDTTVTQTRIATNPFAGVALRSNESTISFADARAGFGNVVPEGQNVSVLTRGSVPVALAIALESGGLPLAGSVVYAMPDGTFQSQTLGGVAPVGGSETNFRVKQVPAGWVVNALIVITNTQNVGA
jgi:hypothetical protein